MKLNRFVYVLNHTSYIEYLDRSMYKFIPVKLRIRFEKMIKPRMVCRFHGQNDEDIKGYGVGVSLLDLDKNKEKFIERLIRGLKEIEIHGVDRIILDDILLLDNNDMMKIQESCNMRIVNGRKTLLTLTPHIIMEICKKCDKDIRNQEVLIIADDDDDTRKLALEIAKEVNYLTIQGLEDSSAEEIADEILAETGLAIHNTYDMNNRIHKYNFIVNLSSNSKVAINKIKKKTIVLDFGIGRGLSYDIRGIRKDIMVISDYIFTTSNKLLCTDESVDLCKELDSHIYEGTSEKIYKKDLRKIKIDTRTYTINQACELFLNSNSYKTKFYMNN